MRHGIHWTPPPPCGLETLPPGYVLEGVPVRFDKHCRTLAQASGIWPWQRIMVGPRWFRLPFDEQQAVLLHELGHCKRRHFEKRLALLLLCWLPAVQRWAQRHELEADAYAAAHGQGAAMLRLIRRQRDLDDSPFYPSPSERIDALQTLLVL